jgi:hypothetical protein
MHIPEYTTRVGRLVLAYITNVVSSFRHSMHPCRQRDLSRLHIGHRQRGHGVCAGDVCEQRSVRRCASAYTDCASDMEPIWNYTEFALRVTQCYLWLIVFVLHVATACPMLANAVNMTCTNTSDVTAASCNAGYYLSNGACNGVL